MEVVRVSAEPLPTAVAAAVLEELDVVVDGAHSAGLAGATGFYVRGRSDVVTHREVN